MVLAHRSPAELDAFLVRRAQAGDRDAFATLMEEYGEVVSRLVRHFVQDGDDARDVEQDTWIRAATHLDSLRDESRFRPWVKSIARTTSLNFLSSRKRRRERVSTFDECGTEDFEDQDAPTPERALMSQESQRKVWLVLGALSERDRTALYLREYQDQPYEAIGERLGISRNAAEVCVFRARERFRKLFAQVESFVPTCGVDGLRLSILLDGEASTGRVDLERHVAGCDCCRERLQTMAAGRALYRNLGVLGFPLLPSAGLLGWLGAIVAKVAALFGGGSEAAAAGGGAATAAGGAGATGAGAATGVAATGTVATAASASGVAAAAGTGIAVGSVGFVATATAAVVVTVGAVVAPVALPQARAASPAPVAAAVIAPQSVGSAPASPQLASLSIASTVTPTGKPATPEVAAGDLAPAPPTLVPGGDAVDPGVPTVLVAVVPASTPATVTPVPAATASLPGASVSSPFEAASVAVSQEPAPSSSAPAATSGDPPPSGSGTAATTQETAVSPKGDHKGGKPDHAGKANDKGGKPEHAAKSDDKGGKPEHAAKSDDKGGKPEAAPKSEDKGGKPEHAAKSDDKGGKPEAAPKSDDKGGKPEAAPKSDDKGGKPEHAAKSDDKGGKPEAGPKSEDKGGKPEGGPKSDDKGGKGKGKNA